MENLTKKRKLEIYKKVLKDIEFGENKYICVAISFSIELEESWILEKGIMYYFPELLEFKPKNKNRDSSWFNSKKKRVRVLERIIKKLENKRTLLDKIKDHLKL